MGIFCGFQHAARLAGTDFHEAAAARLSDRRVQSGKDHGNHQRQRDESDDFPVEGKAGSELRDCGAGLCG